MPPPSDEAQPVKRTAPASAITRAMRAKLNLETLEFGFMVIFKFLSLLYYHCDSAPMIWGSGVAQFSAWWTGAFLLHAIDYVSRD